MNKNKLIELVANSTQLKDYCKSVCKNRDIHNDVFQEFLLKLLQLDEKYLQTKFDNVVFIVFCKQTIRNLNLDRIRVNKLINTRHPLSERHDSFEQNENIEYLINEEKYDFSIDEKFDEVIEFLENTPKVKKYQVSILFNSVSKSMRQISKIIEAPQRQVIYQNNKLKELIRQNVK